MVSIKRGSTQRLQVTLYDTDGVTLLTLQTGATVQLRIGFRGQLGSVRAMTAAGAGTFSYTLTPADTQNLNGPNYMIEVWVLEPTGEMYPMLESPLTITDSVLAP